MKALIKTRDAPDSLEWRDWDDPEPREGEALVRIERAAVCSTDVAIWDGTYRGRQQSVFPAMVGHEAAGVVEAVEGLVDGVVVGDRVCLQVIWGNPQARQVLDGQENLDPDWFHLGTATRPGAFADRIALPAERLIRVDDEVTWEDAALVEALSIAVHAMEKVGLSAGEAFLSVGPGTFGLLTAQIALASGASPVIVIGLAGIDERRLAVARELGVDHVLTYNGDLEALAESVRECTEGEGARCVVEAGGTSTSLPLALEVAAAGGRVALCGFTKECELQPFRTIVRKGLSLHAVAASQRRHYGPALRLISSGLTPSSIVTHRLPMDRAVEAMELMKSRVATKVILEALTT